MSRPKPSSDLTRGQDAFLACFPNFWFLPACFLDRSPDGGAPPSLSHREMPLLGLRSIKLKHASVFIRSNLLNESSLKLLPLTLVDYRGSDRARVTSNPCSERAVKTALAIETRSSGDMASPSRSDVLRECCRVNCMALTMIESTKSWSFISTSEITVRVPPTVLLCSVTHRLDAKSVEAFSMLRHRSVILPAIQAN